MNIDGHNTLACAVDDVKGSDVTIYPLPHMEVIKDLVVDFTPFLSAVQIDPALAAYRKRQSAEGTPAIGGGSRETRRAVRVHPVRLLQHVLPVLLVERDRYLGPAALLQSYRWLADSRDEATGERLDELEDPSSSIAATPS
ncbi:MAG: 2Fe-2S iron-sulfur cluster-binding protein [Geminicoccaceae bacterium]